MKKMFMVIAVIGIVFTGCEKNTQNDERDSFKPTETIINEVSDIEVYTSNNEESSCIGSKTSNENYDYLESLSVGIKDDKNFYSYSGEKVNIEYQYSATGSLSFGLMVLCDGIATPFTTDKTPDESLLQILPNNNNNITEVTLYFTPIGKKGDVVSIEIVDIVEPDYDVTKLDLSQNITPLYQGQKYLVNYISGISCSLDIDGLPINDSILQQYDYIEIPLQERKENIKKNDDGTITSKLDYFNSEWKVNGENNLLYSVNQGEILNVEITYSGTKGQDVLTSFYIDNKIITAFENSDYNKCFVDNSHKSIINGEINTASLTKGIHIFYSVCGNIEFSTITPTKAFIIEVK